jgi:hypothetical protein
MVGQPIERLALPDKIGEYYTVPSSWHIIRPEHCGEPDPKTSAFDAYTSIKIDADETRHLLVYCSTVIVRPTDGQSFPSMPENPLLFTFTLDRNAPRKGTVTSSDGTQTIISKPSLLKDSVMGSTLASYLFNKLERFK